VTARKDLDAVVRAAIRRGWVMERQRSHRVLRHPSGATVVVGTTPGSAKAVTTARTKIENIEANLAGESR